jgi:hypothetical protein
MFLKTELHHWDTVFYPDHRGFGHAHGALIQSRSAIVSLAEAQMERDNILQFPYPVHDLSSEEFASRLAKLIEELEAALSGEEHGYAQRLARIEKASILLNDISLLVSRGSDRNHANETFERVMLSIAELRAKLRKDG